MLAHRHAGLAKGTVLSADDIKQVRRSGLAHLPVAIPEPGDIAEDEAASRLAAILASDTVTADPARHGRVNLRAAGDGVVRISRDSIDAVNAVAEPITLGALADWQRVRRGDIVATVKIIPFFVAGDLIAEAARAAAPLHVAPFASTDVLLIQTRLAETAEKMLLKTAKVTQARVESLGGHMREAPRPAHDVAALADMLKTAHADLILIAGASATSDRRDVIPAALEAAGGKVERLGMPVDPGNLLLLGSMDGRPVIGLPGCARSPKRNGFDMVLERIFAGLVVTAEDIARMGIGGVLAEVERPDPREAAPDRAVRTVGALILAAGRSTRMGTNKLIAPLADGTVVGKTVAAAQSADLPLLVVTGHEAESTCAALPADIAYVHADAYADGMGASLAAGIRALPPEWDAIIIMLGDMPLVEPELLRSMIAAARDSSTIVTPVRDGRRGNPVLWGRDHFAALAGIEGDFGGKTLLAQRQEHIADVEAPSDAIFLDCDTPETLERIRKIAAGNGTDPAKDAPS
ncbi:NTP transferase domain-containing protein [Pacificimonas sp. ICDLI1SI03]